MQGSVMPTTPDAVDTIASTAAGIKVISAQSFKRPPTIVAAVMEQGTVRKNMNTEALTLPHLSLTSDFLARSPNTVHISRAFMPWSKSRSVHSSGTGLVAAILPVVTALSKL